MTRKPNLMGVCLLATFFVIFGSVLSMALFSEGRVATAVSVDAVAEPSSK
jgi:hypothetical protein